MEKYSLTFNCGCVILQANNTLMENLKDTYNKSEQTDNANATSHYTLMTAGIVIGMAGVLLRFTGTWTFIDVISNILLIIGVALALKAVFNILNSPIRK